MMTASLPTIPPGLSGCCFFEFDLVCWTVRANYSPDTTAFPLLSFSPNSFTSGVNLPVVLFGKDRLVNSIGKKRKTSPGVD
jgi:hypothetical protein